MRNLAEEAELQKLINEQARDMAQGNVQQPQRGTIPLTDFVEKKLLPHEGVARYADTWKHREGRGECAYHGRAELYILDGNPDVRCRACDRERERNKSQQRSRRRATDPAYRERRRRIEREAQRRKREANDGV